MVMMKPYSKTVLWRVRHEQKWTAAAWHVAGQAVVLAALGHAVKGVRLTPGHPTRKAVCDHRPTRGGGRARVVGLLASWEARILVTGHGRSFRAEDDYQQAVKLAHAAAGSADEAAALLRALRAEAERLVLANRRAIYRVAEALMASDDLRLTGRQVAAIAAG
jgi:hypothetical protein